MDYDDDSKQCPVCGEKIRSSALKCRFCHEDLQLFEAKQKALIEKVLFTGHPAPIHTVFQLLIAFLSVGIAYVWFYMMSRYTKYAITSQRIRIETGLLTKTVNTIELYRVDDYDLIYPLGMRLLGYGILRVKTSDRTAPCIEIYGIDDIERLYEELRECSEMERERKGIKLFTKT